jgi:hypothetical protein
LAFGKKRSAGAAAEKTEAPPLSGGAFSIYAAVIPGIVIEEQDAVTTI